MNGADTVTVTPHITKLTDAQGFGEFVKAFDMYFGQGGFHMSLNVLNRATLEDAMLQRRLSPIVLDEEVRVPRMRSVRFHWLR